MSFGYQRQPEIFLNNTAKLDAYLYSADGETLIPSSDIHSVSFTVLVPGDDPDTPTVNSEAGAVVADGQGQFVVDETTTTVAGDYKGIAIFIYDEDSNFGLVKSVPVSFVVVDPFERTGPSPADGAIRQCWMFIEDCFDSEFGGPWLRDMTMRDFDMAKVRGLLPQALSAINQQMPFSSYTEAGFPYTMNDGEAILALGLLVETEKHLMRSYTEQPDVVSSPVAFMDRKKYQQAWKAMYDVDSKNFAHLLNRWKLRGYDLSQGSLLIGSKAGRMLPAPMRSRNVGRGF